MCFFVLHSFTGIIEVEVIFFFFFFLEKENSRAQSWVDQRQPGWRKIPPVERKRKEEGKSERKKRHPQQESFGINRETGLQE